MSLSIPQTSLISLQSTYFYSVPQQLVPEYGPNSAEPIGLKIDAFINTIGGFFGGMGLEPLRKIMELIEDGTLSNEDIPTLKSEGYFSRLWSSESWYEWADNRTPLARVISRCCEFATTGTYASLDRDCIERANQAALQLLESYDQFPAVVDLATLNSTEGAIFEGANPYEQIGWSINVAKNFRGTTDALLIGSSSRGVAVMFGQESAQPINVNNLTAKEILIVRGVGGTQDESNPFVGNSEALVIGAPVDSCAYVVFNKNLAAKNFDIKTLNGSNGFSVCDSSKNEALGYAVTICDINDDGIKDYILGAPGVDEQSNVVGRVYVIFGTDDAVWPNPFNLTTLNGKNGFVLQGVELNDFFGSDVACLLRNGSSALIVGVPGHNEGAGVVHVLYGGKKAYRTPIILSKIPEPEGFSIHGSSIYDFIGQTVLAVHDINGDGIDDIAFASDTNNKVYVLFGTNGLRSDLNTTDLDGHNGFIVIGTNNDPQGATGFACSIGASMINGDSIGDLFGGACVASPGYRNSAGQTYVVFGHKGPWNRTIYVDNLTGRDGFIINGASPGDISGGSVNGIGDYNADGADDIAIGAPGSTVNGVEQAGRVYVLYGKKRSITTLPPTGQPIGAIVGPILAILGFVTVFGIAAFAYKKLKKPLPATPSEDTPLVDV
ncbi:MAG: FG-GAP repeat protein [Verrucomicrobia bacterium]|nr:FG-GAP repeat protein [Verrucomicrobiota bacterium]